MVTKLEHWFILSQVQAKIRPGFLDHLWVEINIFALVMHSGCLTGPQICMTPPVSISNAVHVVKIRPIIFPGGVSAVQPTVSLRVGSPTMKSSLLNIKQAHGTLWKPKCHGYSFKLTFSPPWTQGMAHVTVIRGVCESLNSPVLLLPRDRK